MFVRVQVPPRVQGSAKAEPFFLMYHVYAIKSQIKNYIYVGLTANLEDRLHRHQSGYEKTTKPHRPYELIYSKEFATRVEARNHEKYLKSGSGKEFLKKLST